MVTGSCNNCKDTDPILLYASGNSKYTGAFKPGTWWVYQDDSTFARDSVAVTSQEYITDTTTEPCKNDQLKVVNYKETFLTHTTSFLFSENYLWTVKVGEPVLLSKENSSPDTVYTDAACIDTGFCAIIDTLIVGGIKYPAVYLRIDSVSSTEDGNLTRFYTALHFGLIKKEIVTADSSVQSWSLVKSVIVQ
jgi:hypothetical protein